MHIIDVRNFSPYRCSKESFNFIQNNLRKNNYLNLEYDCAQFNMILKFSFKTGDSMILVVTISTFESEAVL